MKKQFSTLLDVFNAAIQYATSPDHSSVTQSVPALSDSITVLTDKVKAINDTESTLSSSITGYTDQKNSLKTNASLLAITVIRPSMAYATQQNDDVLLKQIQNTYTSIFTTKDAGFAAKVNAVIDILSQYQDKIKLFGVTAAALDAVKTAVALFDTFLSQPKTQRSDKKALNQMLDTMIKDANDYLRNSVIPIVGGLRTTETQYYLGFVASCKLDPKGTHHTRLDASIMNEVGQPFVGATVTLDEWTDPKSGKTYKAASSTTNIKGSTTVSEFFAGTRTVTVSGKGVVTKTFGPFRFENGKAMQQTFICQPQFDNLPAPKTEQEIVTK